MLSAAYNTNYEYQDHGAIIELQLPYSVIFDDAVNGQLTGITAPANGSEHSWKIVNTQYTYTMIDYLDSEIVSVLAPTIFSIK